MPLSHKKELDELEPARHGGINYAELEALGLKPEEVLDFSANLNPFGPPPEVREALSRADISSYPDSSSSRLTKKLAEELKVEPENIIIGNGSTELMRLAALACFKPEDPVLMIEPTFEEYRISCQIAGAKIIKYALQAEDSFRLKGSEMAGVIKEHRPVGLFFANPNNPTGDYYPRSIMEDLLEASRGSLVVLDEAYVNFVERPWSSLDLIKDNVLILRSMTKDYALAGLRLGYGIACREIISILKVICPPWNVNVMAQEAGLAALEAKEPLRKSLDKLREAKSYLVAGLKSLGLSPRASQANFFLLETGNAALWRRELLSRKILVRDCSSFGLPSYIRIAVRSEEDCDKLLEAMKELLNEFKRG